MRTGFARLKANARGGLLLNTTDAIIIQLYLEREREIISADTMGTFFFFFFFDKKYYTTRIVET